MIPIPDLLFRLLGYGGLSLVILLRLAQDGSSTLGLLLVFTLLWPGLWCLGVRRQPAVVMPHTAAAQLAHTGESLLITVLVSAAGLGFWLSAAVALLCLTGVTALGGARLLLPAGSAIVIWLLLTVRLGLADWPADGWTLAGVLLASGFLVGLTWLSFARIRRLNAQRRRVLSESAVLRDHNARLARYLPGELAPLITTEPQAPRRPSEQFATVAFVDVVGFVELVAARPVMELTEVLNDFMSTVVAMTERRGGVVGKFLGDGVLIYFARGPDAPASDRRRDAVACARLCLEMGPALDTLTRSWRGKGLNVQLAVRAGIASGCCALGDWGGGRRLDYTLIGMPVNLASRLQAHADPGGVLLTAPTAALIAQEPMLAARLERLGPRTVRGAGEVVVHALSASAKVRAITLPEAPATRVEAP